MRIQGTKTGVADDQLSVMWLSCGCYSSSLWAYDMVMCSILKSHAHCKCLCMYQACGLMICLQHGWWAVLWQDSVLTVKCSICQASRLLTWYTCTCVQASLDDTRNTLVPWTFGICYGLCSLSGLSLEWACYNALMTAMPMSMRAALLELALLLCEKALY